MPVARRRFAVVGGGAVGAVVGAGGCVAAGAGWVAAVGPPPVGPVQAVTTIARMAQTETHWNKRLPDILSPFLRLRKIDPVLDQVVV